LDLDEREVFRAILSREGQELSPLTEPTDSQAGAFGARQSRLRSLLEERRLSFLLVTKPANLFYLTNFRGSAGVGVFGADQNVLWVDPRYTLQARESAQGVEVREEKGRLLKAAMRWLKRQRAPIVGYEHTVLTCAALQELQEGSSGRVRLKPASGLVEELRAVKDPGEAARIREAGHLIAAVFEEVRGVIKPSVPEVDVAAEIEYRMRRRGGDGPAFETIVASGARAALPHARPSAKRLERNELVIIDLGVILGGYAADMTRTLFLGRPNRRIRDLYEAVRESQEQGVAALHDGVRASQVDAAARRALTRWRLARYFTHSTGHGVGLEIHEAPRVARGEKTRLRSGSVITIEPGVYIEGLGGVRIEDTLLVNHGTPEVLTPAPKDAWVIS